jgi:tetratricopeptide (TPR) repeat protein
LAFDFHKTISEKVAALKPNTPATRRAVYEAVRQNLLAHVRAAAPSIPVLTVIAHQRELETAILSIESEARRHDPPPPPPERKPRQKKPEAKAPTEADPAPAPTAQIESAEEKIQPAPALDPAPASVAATEAPKDASPASKEEALATAKDERDPASVDTTRALESAIAPEPVATVAMSHDEPPQIETPEVRITSVTAPVETEATAPESEFVQYESEPADADGPIEPPTRAPLKLVIYVTTAAVVGATIVLAAAFTWNALEVAPPAPTPKSAPVAKGTVKAVEAPPGAAGLIASAGFNVAAQAPYRQGLDLLAQGDLTRAILAFDDSIRLDANQPAAYGYRAFAHWNKGSADLAARDYSEAIRLDPKNVGYRLNRAIALNKLGNHADAIADLNEVVSVQPENAAALNSRCWARALVGALDEALTDCNQAVRLSPSDANALDSRGFVHLKAGRLVRAVADYSSALRINPKLASSLYGRGIAKIGRGDRGGGTEDVAAAKAVNPDIQAEFARYGIR